MDKEQELRKMINVLRQTARMALQSEWTGSAKDAATICARALQPHPFATQRAGADGCQHLRTSGGREFARSGCNWHAASSPRTSKRRLVGLRDGPEPMRSAAIRSVSRNSGENLREMSEISGSSCGSAWMNGHNDTKPKPGSGNPGTVGRQAPARHH